MREALPQSVDPARLAGLGRELAGNLALARMPRLAALIAEAGPADQGYAAFRLHFCRDASGRDLVQGTVSATLRLRCQRCNDVLELPVSSAFTLAVVHGLDEAARLPAEYEPLLPEESEIDPALLVEDELLLAVPAVPRHAEGTCRPPRPMAADRAHAREMPHDDNLSTHRNPFAALQALKRHH